MSLTEIMETTKVAKITNNGISALEIRKITKTRKWI